MSGNRSDPGEVYAERHRARVREAARQARLARLPPRARLAVFAAGVANACAVYAFEPVAMATLLLPAAAFAALVIAHDSLRGRRARADRAVEFYERGLARLELRFAGRGRDGLRFLDPDHPYARALDLFGPGSLYELLSQSQTVAGEEILARWLVGDPGAAAQLPAVVRDRQLAVQELRDGLDLREDLFVAGPEVRSRVDSRALAAWGRAQGSAPVGLRASAAAVFGEERQQCANALGVCGVINLPGYQQLLVQVESIALDVLVGRPAALDLRYFRLGRPRRLRPCGSR